MPVYLPKKETTMRDERTLETCAVCRGNPEGQVFDILRLNVNRDGPMIRLNSPNNEYD
jgi:hypothetical protein